MLFSPPYMVFRALFRVAPAGEDRDHEFEILVLRHLLMVSQRKQPRNDQPPEKFKESSLSINT